MKAVVKKLISDATRGQSKVLRETALNSGLVSKQVQDPKIELWNLTVCGVLVLVAEQ